MSERIVTIDDDPDALTWDQLKQLVRLLRAPRGSPARDVSDRGLRDVIAAAIKQRDHSSYSWVTPWFVEAMARELLSLRAERRQTNRDDSSIVREYVVRGPEWFDEATRKPEPTS